MQVASAFPTAGGPYHWSSILGGKGWGWTTACFNLAGLITVLAAINVGACRFAVRPSSAGSLICDRAGDGPDPSDAGHRPDAASQA